MVLWFLESVRGRDLSWKDWGRPESFVLEVIIGSFYPCCANRPDCWLALGVMCISLLLS